MSRIKALVYDVDGTLIDSEPLHIEAWDSALQTYGHSLNDMPAAFIHQRAGQKPFDIAQEIAETLHLPVPAEKLLKRKTDLFLAAVPTQLKLTQGALDSISRFKAAGFRLAIGTSLDRTYLNDILDRFGIRQSFEVIVTGDQIHRGKPDPETYLLVADRLDIKPSDCLVFEDAHSGVQAAKAAGMYCIALKGANAVTQDLSAADLVANSFDDVTTETITAA